MAIKKRLEFKGLVVENVYIRVVMPTIRPGNKQFDFIVQFMATAEHEPFTVSTFEAAYDLLGDNPLKQAYAHLKSLEEFSGVVDC